MSSAPSIDALDLGFGKTIGPRLPSCELTANSPSLVSSFKENQILFREGGQYAFPLPGQARMVWSKKDHHPRVVLTAFLSLAAAVAVAFLVLQCFKAIGKKSWLDQSLRRLSDSESEEVTKCIEHESRSEDAILASWSGVMAVNLIKSEISRVLYSLSSASCEVGEAPQP
ncbi:hypothetical protein Efla_007515 [Eimeria flavescens]